MERKRITPLKSLDNQATSEAEVTSIAQIRDLVHLLDRSDIAELEVKCAGEDVHLVLRKAQALDGTLLGGEVASLPTGDEAAATTAPADETRTHRVVAPLVGLFHPWLKPRGGTLVAVGDHVKAGQLVGTIESLNVLNEVECTVAGHVLEVHAQDGQPVEYGQVLVTIALDGVEEA